MCSRISTVSVWSHREGREASSPTVTCTWNPTGTKLLPLSTSQRVPGKKEEERIIMSLCSLEIWSLFNILFLCSIIYLFIILLMAYELSDNNVSREHASQTWDFLTTHGKSWVSHVPGLMGTYKFDGNAWKFETCFILLISFLSLLLWYCYYSICLYCELIEGTMLLLKLDKIWKFYFKFHSCNPETVFAGQMLSELHQLTMH